VRSNRLMVTFIIAGALAFAQSPAPPEEKPASVEGAVTQSISGAPLPRVQVHLMAIANSDQIYGASTGADGKFSIAGIPKGTYTVTAKRAGFVMPLGRDGRREFEVALQPGDKKDDLDVKLTPTGAISGRVTGVDGVPMEGSNVTADDGTGEGPQLQPRVQSTTDANGDFRIGGLAPGKYRVRAGQEFVPFQPEIRTDGTEQIHYSPTYFPNALEHAAATRIEVRPDSEAGGIAIHMVRTPIVFVRGIVLGAPGNANITVLFGANGSFDVAGVKQDGTFQIPNLNPGKYRLFANANLGGQRLRSTVVDVEVADKSIDRVELRMMPAISISGKLDYDDERAKPQAPLPRIRLIDLIAGTQPDRAAVHEDGSFALTDLLPGLYRVTLSWPGLFVRSLRLGMDATEGSLLDLRNGVTGSALSVLVSSAVGEVTGVVSDSNGPIPNARVALSLDDVNAERPAVTFRTADAAGNYRFGNLAPGKYRLAAVDDGDAAAAKGVLDDYQDVLTEIEIHEDDKVTQNLTRRAPPK
jgi:Carboxypeptidase regulatory-like domain